MCVVYDSLFQWLLGLWSNLVKIYLRECEMQCVKPRIILDRLQSSLANSGRNQPAFQDMSHFVRFLSALMDVGVQAPLFSSALLLKTSCELLVGEVENIVHKEDAVEVEKA